MLMEREQVVTKAKKDARQFYKSKIDELNKVVLSVADSEEKVKTLRKKNKALQRGKEQTMARLSQDGAALQEEQGSRETLQLQL